MDNKDVSDKLITEAELNEARKKRERKICDLTGGLPRSTGSDGKEICYYQLERGSEYKKQCPFFVYKQRIHKRIYGTPLKLCPEAENILYGTRNLRQHGF